MMDDTRLKPCPFCEGEIVLMTGIKRVPPIYAKCTKCGFECDLPEVKLKTLRHKPMKISKTTLTKATKAWNKRADRMKHVVFCKDCIYRYTPYCSAKHEREDLDFCGKGRTDNG